jgi:hypothetical protein
VPPRHDGSGEPDPPPTYRVPSWPHGHQARPGLHRRRR